MHISVSASVMFSGLRLNAGVYSTNTVYCLLFKNKTLSFVTHLNCYLFLAQFKWRVKYDTHCIVGYITIDFDFAKSARSFFAYRNFG